MADFLENLKKRYLNAPPEGKALLRENILALAHSMGMGDQIRQWFEEVDRPVLMSQEQGLTENVEGFKAEGPKAQEESEKEEKIKEEEKKEEIVKEEEKAETEKSDNLKEIIMRLDQITERIKEHEDALAEHKKILEKLIEPEKFEDKKEELREKDTITPGEFGVRFSDDDNKIYKNLKREGYYEAESNIPQKNEKEDNMSFKTPTERRKERIGKKLAQAQAQEEPKSLSEFYDIPKDIEKMKKLPQIPEPPFVTEEELKERKKREKEQLKERVWDLSRLAAELDEENKRWILSYEGRPIAIVPYTETAVDFESRKFGTELLKTLVKDGLDALKEKFAAQILESQEKEETKEEKKEEKEEKKEEKEAFELRFNRALKLARMVLDKNLAENPLKGKLFTILNQRAGIKNPSPYIEEAFRSASEKYFDTIISLAQKYMSMDDKTFVEVEDFVRNARVQIPEVVVEERNDIIREVEAEELRRRASAGSIPVTTTSFEKMDPLKKAVPKPMNWYSIKQ